jgi:hypothetical protein
MLSKRPIRSRVIFRAPIGKAKFARVISSQFSHSHTGSPGRRSG